MEKDHNFQTQNRSKKILIWASVLLVVMAIVLIVLRIKAHREYLKTPIGELEDLSRQAEPITATPQERANEMEVQSQTSVGSGYSKEEREKILEQLNEI